MTDNDYVGMDFPDEIATHECGHVVALAATGLTEAFRSATIVPQNGVLGLTIRSGESLTKLSNKLSELSNKLLELSKKNLADQTEIEAFQTEIEAFQTEIEAFRNFVLTTPAVCLPHICFFLGGGSIDRLLGRENARRNSIDAEYIREKVVPAMLLPSLSDDDLLYVQSNVDKFLHNVFTKEKILFNRIYHAIVEHKTLVYTSIDPNLMKEMKACGERSAEAYKSLLAAVEEWYAGQVMQLPYFQR